MNSKYCYDMGGGSDNPYSYECGLPKGHKHEHMNGNYIWKNHKDPTPGPVCKTCKHKVIAHTPPKLPTVELMMSGDYVVNKYHGYCVTCENSYPSYPPNHYPHHTSEWSRNRWNKVRAEAEAKKQEACETCDHAFQYHNKTTGSGLQGCLFCSGPKQVHAFNGPPDWKKLNKMKCSFSACGHGFPAHTLEGGQCETCIMSIQPSKASIKELLSVRHTFTVKGTAYFDYHWEQAQGELEAAHKAGIQPDKFRLAQACADFYMLERLTADGSKTAAELYRTRSEEIAHEVGTYLDLACGGEVRYAGRRGGGADNCEGSYLWSCGGSGCGAGCCCTCDSDRMHDRKYDPDREKKKLKLGSDLDDFITACEDYSRSGAWAQWWEFRQNVGIEIIREMYECFNDTDIWGYDSSFGGQAWGTAAKVLYEWRAGLISTQLFLDRCWTLQHNGGCIFNKVYHSKDISWLMTVLEKQAEDDYTYLYRHASYNVRKLWDNRKFILRPEDKIVQVSMMGDTEYRYGFKDRDPAWLGIQITDGEREGW